MPLFAYHYVDSLQHVKKQNEINWLQFYYKGIWQIGNAYHKVFIAFCFPATKKTTCEQLRMQTDGNLKEIWH